MLAINRRSRLPCWKYIDRGREQTQRHWRNRFVSKRLVSYPRPLDMSFFFIYCSRIFQDIRKKNKTNLSEENYFTFINEIYNHGSCDWNKNIPMKRIYYSIKERREFLCSYWNISGSLYIQSLFIASFFCVAVFCVLFHPADVDVQMNALTVLHA